MVRFGQTLAETRLPEWRAHYLDYDGLKQKLQQARDTADAFPEAAQPVGTSLSIRRSVSQTPAALLQQQHQDNQEHVDTPHQYLQDSARLLLQQQQQTAPLGRPSSSSGVPQALLLDGGPAEQFLQLLQQELHKVRDFITSQGSSLQAELRSLAAAAPQLSHQDCQRLERQANELGRQLLALESYIQLNQAGFVKIVKKHDKWLPDAPIWHLYLHHLQRSPWLDDSRRQYMWAALSSCYFHLHAASIHSSRERRQASQQQQKQQQQQQQQLSPGREGRPRAVEQQQQQHSPPLRPGTAQSAAVSSGRKVVGGLTSAFGSAVSGAASAVAGAASAVAGASAAAMVAAAAAASGAAGPPTLAASGSAAQAAATQAAAAAAGEDGTVRLTRKFWVREADVPAVMYYVLQHLPLLPSTLHPTAAAASTGAEQGGKGTRAELGGTHYKRQQQQDVHQQQQAAGGEAQQRQHLLLQPSLEGFTTSLHTVYFDNRALQLYHGRLFLRPQTQTLKARWIAQGQHGSDVPGVFGGGVSEGGCCPDKVVLERKVYREGWRGEPNTKDSLLIAGDKLAPYLAGMYTLGDALADLCEVPACRAQLVRASSSVSSRQQQQQQQQDGTRRTLLASPFAQPSAAAAAATGAGAGTGLTHAAVQQSGEAATDTAAASVAEAGEGDEVEEESTAAALAAGVRLPRGFAIGSFSSRSVRQSSAGGSNPSLLQLLEREQQQQQQQQQQGQGQPPRAGPVTASRPAAAAAEDDDGLEAGFADAYLDPPVPTADQLSLFMEVQRFVGRRRLAPVLHSVLTRMVFAMPFDDSIRITLDTDVRTAALGGQDLPAGQGYWPQQQQQLLLSGASGRMSSPGVLSAKLSTEQSTPAPAPAAGSGYSYNPPLPPRHPSSYGGSVPPELQASCALWDSIFSPRGFVAAANGASTDAQHSCGSVAGEPGSPAYGHSSSGGGGGGGGSSSLRDASAMVYPLPYCLLKVTCRQQASNSTPDWLQQLMDSEAVVPVEDWSKFIHGCAVLLPETVRAVPYWMDDALIELSVDAFQAQLEAEEARREQQLLRQQTSQLHPKQRTSSTGSLLSAGGAAGSSSIGGASPAAGEGWSPRTGSQQQQQQTILQRPSSSARGALNRTSSGGSDSRSLQPSSSGGGIFAAGVQQLMPQLQGYQSGSAASAADSSSSSRPLSRLRVSTQGGAPGVQRVSWAGSGAHGSSSAAGTPTHSEAATPAAAAPAAGGLVHRLLRLVRKDRPPPLFRPEGSRTRRTRRYSPVQLLESREYLYSESVFLAWLNVAITLASVAVLLMGYSSMAYVNPLKRPTMHVAELICLCMLPCSCVIVGYAIRTYVWRSKRLHSMRYSRVDDPVGPLVMALLFVASMSAVMLVNIADLVLMLRAHDSDPSGGGGDDPGGGRDDDPGGGDMRLAGALGLPAALVQGALQLTQRRG